MWSIEGNADVINITASLTVVVGVESPVSISISMSIRLGIFSAAVVSRLHEEGRRTKLVEERYRGFFAECSNFRCDCRNCGSKPSAGHSLDTAGT